ncbi:hypothetical protein COV04_00595 [Candidatus Uhrbacteria bacterium CG10_big_fil_rev_8_21_14_0_10_48_11]|uniref:Undecaprenyl-phosphate alpha-N-acetylglucosaminyl 1-phosphate transferase n=1 Tax=Candidatus Uhrbacteria bacterium CG10_big_fil_rev_8_21_14_0_10_48_11 TaxID=1975037 RepID=A0A2M8LFM0_9BACT|nr:MAG: hypothetical protein COV04_00595 [Candidatus Uhrbacteria bacterium CG10_big_fil_rev_8_21_14_0_10_48_11]
MIYAFAFIAAAVLTAAAVPLVMRFAYRFKVIDDPAIEGERRMHQHRIPLLGGIAVWFSVSFVTTFFLLVNPDALLHYIKVPYLFGAFLGTTILMIGGFIDDRFKLGTFWKLALPFIAALLAVLTGVGVNFITNPFGGVWRIDKVMLPLISVGGFSYALSLGSVAFTVLWLMATMLTTKVLDGLDGLVSGVVGIGALVIVILSLRPPVLQPDTALMAAIISGAFFGFLPFNWSPAKIFLGEGGSLFAGYCLGILAVIAGGKIATAGIILAVPILDATWVVLRRVFFEHRSPVSPDRLHLHFILLKYGLSVRLVVLLFYMLTMLSGILALSLSSLQKLYAATAIAILFIISVALPLLVRRREQNDYDR